MERKYTVVKQSSIPAHKLLDLTSGGYGARIVFLPGQRSLSLCLIAEKSPVLPRLDGTQLPPQVL